MKKGLYMAKLVSFMMSSFSQSIPNSDGGQVQQLTGPIIVLRPRFIPSEHSFSITIGINDINLDTQNSIRMILRSPSGKTTVDTGETVLPAAPEDTLLPKHLQGFVMSWGLQNATFEEAGVFKLEIDFNGYQLSTQDIPVYPLGIEQ